MYFLLPDSVNSIIKTLEQAGYEAWCVGGCVRDLTMGITPKDYDITTSALPEQIKSLFEKTVDTGIEHGTVTVIISNIPYEVTSYRTDGDYKNCRKPEQVKFVTDIKSDLSRRDFTVNAMAYHPSRGLLDIFGGKDDIENRILRTVGDPNIRFSEDALRILRLFRFSSVLNFSIEKNTLNSALKYAYELELISRERINSEFFKILLSDFSQNSEILFSSGMLSFIGIKTANLNNLKHYEQDRFIRFAAFCFENGCDSEILCNSLKCDNALKKYCKNIEIILNNLPKDRFETKYSMYKYGEKETHDAFVIKGKNENAQQVTDILVSKEPYLLSHLAVNGNDLSALGYSGNTIGKALNILLKKVMYDPDLNQKEKLISLLP